MTAAEITDIVRAVPLSTLAAMSGLPADLQIKVTEMQSMGASMVDIASMVDAGGYRIVIIPAETEEDELEGDDEEDMESDEEEEEDSEEESESSGLMGLLDRLRSVFGKAISFESENATISRNRKRAAARGPHTFQAAVWATRKGVIRCRICGGPSPEAGGDCPGTMSKDAYMEVETEVDEHLGDLTIRSAAVAEAHDMIVDAIGCWSPEDAHYLPESPFLDQGLACINCVAFCPEIAGCYWVEGPIQPEGICKLWVIPEKLQIRQPMTKEIVERNGEWCVTSADGSRSFGCYPSQQEAQDRLDQVERFAKADTYAPPQGVREEAQRAIGWIEEGHAGPGFTATGRRRASDLANGNEISIDTIRRMSSFLARHEVDKQGEGWKPGEAGYPSPGRVAWAAWGGDPAVSWTRSILDSVEKYGPTVSEVHVDVPMGAGGRQPRRRPRSMPMMSEGLSKTIGVGSYVSWGSSGGRARGRVERVVTDGRLNVPDSSFTIEGSDDDPAVLIRLWRETPEGWRPTETRVGHLLSTLTEIEPLERSAAIAGIFTKADDRRFTLGPWYVPDSYDAHGEWTDSEELQTALWDYVRKGDRQIRLQHDVEIVAGEWVEALTWPYPVNVPMLDATTGMAREQEFPAGTVFMGVVWEPWAWDLVKAGKIRGYSMGGAGQRVTVDLPMEGSL